VLPVRPVSALRFSLRAVKTGLRGKALIGAATLVACATAATSASGAVTVGSDLERVPNITACGGIVAGGDPCTWAISGLAATSDAAGGATVSQPGVIVRWRVRRDSTGFEADESVSLRVIRANTGAGRSAIETLPMAAGTYDYATRLPVQAGDQIGIDLPYSFLSIEELRIAGPVTGAGDEADIWAPPLAEGATASPTTADLAVELMINADVEPDADGDGFGDETQDQCSTDAATQGVCASAGPPETTITKKPKKKLKKPKTTVEFSSNVATATFECRLDSKPFAACTSPHKLKKLKKGKHTFAVRAVAGGIADSTPAEAKFKVKKKPKRK
jgi:hypothetical protein